MDLVMHTCHQSEAARLVQLFDAKELNVFPVGFAAEAEEVGPRTDHKGPCLAWFKHVGLPPGEVLSWFTASILRRHVGRLYWLERRHGEATSSREELLRVLIAAGPPAADSSPTAAATAAAGATCQMEQHHDLAPTLQGSCCDGNSAGRGDGGGATPSPSHGDGGAAVVRLTCYPRDLEKFLQAELPLEWDLRPRGFTHVLSVVETSEGRYRWGVVPVAWHYTQAANLPYAFPGAVASAIGKLDEALSVTVGSGMVARRPPRAAFGDCPQLPENLPGATPDAELQQQKPQKLPAAAQEPAHAPGQLGQQGPAQGVGPGGGEPLLGAAIDLGAAPGGWTAYLARHARCAVAVDPAALHPDVLSACPNIRHLRVKAEAQAVPLVMQALDGQMADVLTCDMNKQHRDVIPIIRSMLPCLRPGGTVIVTLKFFGIARERGRVLDAMREQLQDVLENHRVVWLLANTVNERTYLATKRLRDSGAAGDGSGPGANECP